MDKYKIQLFNYILDTERDYFLWVTNPKVEEDLEKLRNKQILNHFNATSDKFDREEDLDLFKAKAWHHKLTQLGVECAIVKIDYSEEN